MAGGGGNKYDLNALNEILNELIKIFYKGKMHIGLY